MKKFIIIISALISILTIHISCNKDNEQIKENKPTIAQQALTAAVLPSDANAEVQRIFADVQGNKYVFGVIANPNFGNSKSHDIYLSGKTPADLYLSINGVNYSNNNGRWMQQSQAFGSYFGNNVTVTVKKGSSQFNKTMYIPKMVVCPKICDQYQYINRTGNMLNWNVDQQNPMNKVAISYELYDSDDLFGNAAPYEKNIILVNNSGSYNMDNLISNPQCKRINFMIVSGNAFSFTINQEKYLFDLFSADHHEYLIR